MTERLNRIWDRRRIAIIPLHGVIGGAVRTEALLRALNHARRSRAVRGVLLDIDSPGGGAVASEVLHIATKERREQATIVGTMPQPVSFSTSRLPHLRPVS